MVIYCVFSKCKTIHQTSLYIYVYPSSVSFQYSALVGF